MKCKLCSDTAVVEKGFINVAAFLYPLCKVHMKEYLEYKDSIQ